MSEPDMYAGGIALVAGYVIGGIPFGLIIGWMKGVDIRKVGSGNIGATNLGRALGKRWGIVCLVLDIAKGLLPVLFVAPAIANALLGAGELIASAAMGVGTILGHVFCPYLGFRGGKGVATTIGAFGALLHWWILLPLVGYIVVRKTSGFVSAGSITLAILLPAAAALKHRSDLSTAWPVVALAAATGVLVLIRHASNIKRLVSGEEMAAPVKEAQAGGAADGGE
jgi:glycerol-3-phosphate acyltransferase PlsY